jgi:hypothetical protein
VKRANLGGVREGIEDAVSVRFGVGGDGFACADWLRLIAPGAQEQARRGSPK